jgi:protein phosphatase
MESHARLEFAARTDTGLVRTHNEDAIEINPDYGLAILADGMGGYSAGEVASNMAVMVLKGALEEGMDRLAGAVKTGGQRGERIGQLLVDAIGQANAAIFDAARAEPGYSGMGTTLVVALFRDENLTIAHVGDSRTYRLRHGQLAQLTRDHSLLQEQIDAGLISAESARFSEFRNLVTRAVGVGPEVEIETHEHQVEPGDLYLLCSDGLTDMLTDEEIGSLLANGQAALDTLCTGLITRANDGGGRDNISAILVRVPEGAFRPAGWLKRMRRWMRQD